MHIRNSTLFEPGYHLIIVQEQGVCSDNILLDVKQQG